MEQHSYQRWRIRLWPTLIVLLLLVLIGLALSIYEGKRHQRIAEELEARGVIVGLSHFVVVPVSRHPTDPSGVISEYQSTLPKLMDQTGLSLAVRRIRQVSVMGPSQLPDALPLMRQIGELNDLGFYNSSDVTASQLESLLSNVQVRQRLFIQTAKLPPTRLPWLNQKGLIQLQIQKTDFSNPAIDDLPDSLTWLQANRTLINDDGLDSFVRLKNLTYLNLKQTPCTAAGIEDLRKKMPWCKIEWEPLVNP